MADPTLLAHVEPGRIFVSQVCQIQGKTQEFGVRMSE